MKILDLEFKPYIKSGDIALAVKALGNKLNRDYERRNPLFLVILNGAFVFAADLYRELKIESEISFIKLSSYHKSQSTGKINELIGLDHKIYNRNVVILEDIIDTGLTLHHTLESLKELGAASTEVVALFLKPESLKKKLRIKYTGFEIPGDFIVGYGMDYEGYGRNLKDVYILK